MPFFRPRQPQTPPAKAPAPIPVSAPEPVYQEQDHAAEIPEAEYEDYEDAGAPAPEPVPATPPAPAAPVFVAARPAPAPAPLPKPVTQPTPQPIAPVVMPENPNKNILSKDVEIKGNIRFTNELIIDGKIEGEIHSDGVLTVGENADIRGEVKTKSVTVLGKVVGNITVTERAELKARAHLVGDLKAARLVIEEGATFVGKSEVTTNKAVLGGAGSINKGVTTGQPSTPAPVAAGSTPAAKEESSRAATPAADEDAGNANRGGEKLATFGR